MDILSGKEELDRFLQTYIDAQKREMAEWAPKEFVEISRLDAYQAAFAEHFSVRASGVWIDLGFLTPLAIEWYTARWTIVRGKQNSQTIIQLANANRAIDFAVRKWTTKYKIDTPWMRVMALVTLRGMVFHQIFGLDTPKTLLHNRVPVVVVEDDDVALEYLSFQTQPISVIEVRPNLGAREWDTLTDTKAQFRRRFIEAFIKELDDQLSRVSEPTLVAADLDVKWHWIDMTIDRYAGGKSKRWIAKEHGVSRPAVDKAVEAIRRRLGFHDLPESWGATPIETW